MKANHRSAANFLTNNDLNVTGSCMHVDFSRNDLFSVHASASFWEFVFQKNDSRMIKTVKSFDQSKCDARTCVHMLFKAFEMVSNLILEY